MKSDINGCSTCPVGKENYEFFNINLGRKTYEKVQYDYRHTDGELFSCVANSLEEAREKRNKWLESK